MKSKIGLKTFLSQHHISYSKIALFCALFFLIMTVLTSVVIIPKINTMLENNREQDIGLKLALESQIFSRYINSKQKFMADIAQNPILVNTVMTSGKANRSLIYYLDNLKINGQQGRFIVQDIEGNILFKSSKTLQGFYSHEQPWFNQLLNSTRDFHLELLEQNDGSLSFKMSVPIRYGHNAEGILSAEIDAPLESLFIGQDYGHVAFKLVQNGRTIRTTSDHIKKPKEHSIPLRQMGLDFILITDEYRFIQDKIQLNNTILLILIAGLSFSFVVFFCISYQILREKSTTGKTSQIRFRLYFIPLSITFLGLVATVIAGTFFKTTQSQHQQEDIAHAMKNNVSALRNTMNIKLGALHTLKDLYRASQNVDRQEFKLFTTSLLKKYAYIKALGWAPNILYSQKKALISQAKKQGLDHFVLKQTTAPYTLIDTFTPETASAVSMRANYRPLYFINPLENNEHSLGFDLGSHPDYLQALQRAGQNNTNIATAPVTLQSPEEPDSRVLIFLPHYHQKYTQDNTKKTLGFLLIAIDPKQMVEQVFNNSLANMSIDIQDKTNPENSIEVYNTTTAQSSASQEFHYIETIEFAGRQWQITLTPTSQLIDKTPQTFFWLMISSSSLLSLFIGFVLFQQIHRRYAVEALVTARTAELKMLNDLVAHSNDVFLIAQSTSAHQPQDWPTIIYTNDAFTRQTQLSRADAIGQTLDILNGPQTDAAQLTAMHHALHNGHPYKDELIQYTKNQQQYWVDISIWPLKSQLDNVFQFAIIQRDITALKKEQLRHKELQQAMQLAVEGIAKISQQGFYLYVNEAYAAALGQSVATLTGQHWHHGMPPSQFEKIQSTFEEMRTKGKAITETVGQDNNGAALYMQITMIADYNLQAEFIGHFCFLQNINQRKQADQQRELLIEKLAKSNEELERFAYVCSHDLQEPLRMIRSFSEKLQKHIGNTLEQDEKGQKYFHFITDGAERAQDLISDILNFSSIESDLQPMQEIDTQELVKNIKQSLYINNELQTGEITFDALPTVSGQKSQLHQLFQNLINNGMKYQPKNSNAHVHISVQSLEHHWQFSIQDNGIGIEERHLTTIFDVFKRLHRKSKYSGTGIGLAICKKVVQGHGGHIWVESTLERGSTFHFTIVKSNQQERHDD